MSFSDHDPVNHLDIRIRGELCYIECESCGWDSERGFPPGQLTDDTVKSLILLWHKHLVKAHPNRFPCQAKVILPGGEERQCEKNSGHEGNHEYIVRWG